jgi:hypothetical protein
MLDDYRRAFGDAYEHVVSTIRRDLHLQPTGRPAKSTASIIEKLGRESMRLSQMQDIAGCRVVVDSLSEQDEVLNSLKRAFAKIAVVDRRVKPSYGYRAVHVIVEASRKSVEIQVRTSHQHAWAEFSEKLSDTVDFRIKYGGGPPKVVQGLDAFSLGFAKLDSANVIRLDAPQRLAPVTERAKVDQAGAKAELDDIARNVHKMETLMSEAKTLMSQAMKLLDVEARRRS